MSKQTSKLIYERAMQYAETHLHKITVQMGRYDGSQRCQHVSRQLLEEGSAESVVVTLCFVPNSGVVVHFINKIQGKYVDHSIGYLSKRNIYYFFSEHTLEDLAETDMSKMLVSVKVRILSRLFSSQEILENGITTANM